MANFQRQLSCRQPMEIYTAGPSGPAGCSVSISLLRHDRGGVTGDEGHQKLIFVATCIWRGGPACVNWPNVEDGSVGYAPRPKALFTSTKFTRLNRLNTS